MATDGGKVNAAIKLMKEKASVKKVDAKGRNIMHYLAAETGNATLFKVRFQILCACIILHARDTIGMKRIII